MKLIIDHKSDPDQSVEFVPKDEFRWVIEMDNGDLFILSDVPSNEGTFSIYNEEFPMALRPRSANSVDVSRA